MNPLLELAEHGQSYWLDNLTRGMIQDGGLKHRVEEEGLRGVTSNPSIFNKAITGGAEYDEQIRELAEAGLPVSEIYERLVVRDVRDACDVLRPVHDDTDGRDGYVSLEVSPYLAHDTEGSVEEAVRLFDAVDRPNAFIKIPGTDAGAPAIEELLYRGVNVNVTLLFSIDAYEAVARAYLRALERRLEDGRSVDDVASVASFFLSRIDVLVDRILGHRVATGRVGREASALLGRAGIANAKLAYQRFLELFSGDRWERLEAEGARVQRMLWASTSTKDPLYSDVRYIEPLIGPHTVNTLPERSIRAFADHGTVRETVEEDVDEARSVMDRLREVGVDFDHVTEQLLYEGVQKFIDPYDRLMATLADRAERIAGRPASGQTLVLGDLEGAVEDVVDSLGIRQFPRRLAQGDPGAWAPEAGEPDRIEEGLGWLRAPEEFADRVPELERFAAELTPPEVQDVLWLGMGGSAEAARLAADAFGPADGRPRLRVLDDVSPAAVRRAEEQVDPGRTLFVVASKSGTTAETLALYRYFRARASEAVDGDVGSRFVAVTDPGTPLAAEAAERGFRRCFKNPADVGGRYSALTYFGLLPLALLGRDPAGVLSEARALQDRYDESVPADGHPPVRLGAALGALAEEGRDKVTLTASEDLSGFPGWLEQLLAESTGKEGAGLVPVVGEPPSTPADYGDERVFVHVRTGGAEDREAVRRLEALEQAGHPVVRTELESLEQVGAELYRWEVAVATAGRVLGVNPFDQPNVEESKEKARKILESATPGPSSERRTLSAGSLRISAAAGAGWTTGEETGGEGLLRRALGALPEGGYLALLPFFAPTPERRTALGRLRVRLRERLGAATLLGFGPRYLHSTGQLHKGGPADGVFLVMTADEGELEIPGEPHGFGDLQRAQALGDLEALEARGRPALHVHLGEDVEGGLRELYRLLAEDREPTEGRVAAPA